MNTILRHQDLSTQVAQLCIEIVLEHCYFTFPSVVPSKPAVSFSRIGIISFSCVQISQACKPIVVKIGFWESVKSLSRGYEFMMGLLLFIPVAVLSWFPFVSEFQTRLLFNQAFSRGLQISRILAGRKKL